MYLRAKPRTVLAITFMYNGGNILILWGTLWCSDCYIRMFWMAKWDISMKRKLAFENLTSVYYLYGVPSERVAIADQIHHNYSKLTRLPSGLFSALSGTCCWDPVFFPAGDTGPPVPAVPSSPVVPCMQRCDKYWAVPACHGCRGIVPSGFTRLWPLPSVRATYSLTKGGAFWGESALT